jgi:hypothetical protein
MEGFFIITARIHLGTFHMSEWGTSIIEYLRGIHSQLYPNGRLYSSDSRTSEVPDDRHTFPGKDRQFSVRRYAISYSALPIKGFLPEWRLKGLKMTSPPFSVDGEKKQLLATSVWMKQRDFAQNYFCKISYIGLYNKFSKRSYCV